MNTIKIKYHGNDLPKVEIKEGSDWIDLYASETVFVPFCKQVLVPLGISVELPEGYEAEIRPRSSTFKTWGVIQSNSCGVIDESFKGDNDIWCFPAVALDTSEAEIEYVQHGLPVPTGRVGRYVRKGDKICQFRINKKMGSVELVEVEHLGNKDRGGFGSTGRR